MLVLPVPSCAICYQLSKTVDRRPSVEQVRSPRRGWQVQGGFVFVVEAQVHQLVGTLLSRKVDR